MIEVALIDSGADMNCIQEWIIPLKYFEKSSKKLTQANGEKLIINYKIPIVHIYNDGVCFETVFVLIKSFTMLILLFSLWNELVIDLRIPLEERLNWILLKSLFLLI